LNFYERHIGDYIKKTAHLSLLEHGVLTRLRDVYLDREAPIPEDKAARLIAARTEPETQALQVVLQEFFQLRDGMWVCDECETLIAAFAAGEPEREVKKANEDNRLKRHRQERAALFKVLTDRGEHAPWNIGMEELRQRVAALQVPGPETPAATRPATAAATPATATHSPLPTTHYPVEEDKGATAPSSPASPTTAPVDNFLTLEDEPASIPPCPLKQLVALFSAKVPELPKPRFEMWKDSAGAEAMRQRWKWLLGPDAVREDNSRYATNAAEAIDWFGRFFDTVKASDFLTGRKGDWKNCDLAWLMKRENFLKVVQGNYTNREHA
jgi:uncharacterized protein YdaU (DUF1376 family)